MRSFHVMLALLLALTLSSALRIGGPAPSAALLRYRGGADAVPVDASPQEEAEEEAETEIEAAAEEEAAEEVEAAAEAAAEPPPAVAPSAPPAAAGVSPVPKMQAQLSKLPKAALPVGIATAGLLIAFTMGLGPFGGAAAVAVIEGFAPEDEVPQESSRAPKRDNSDDYWLDRQIDKAVDYLKAKFGR